MNRRGFLASVIVAGLAFSAPAMAVKSQFIDYKPGVLEKALGSGKSVLLDYSATWCGTCKVQEQVLDQLIIDNPAYANGITYIRVDWDTYKAHSVTRDRNIPRRSTLVMLKGGKEVGRIVAGTARSEIQSLLDKGL